MDSYAKLQQLLLDLISPLPQVDEQSVAALTTADWEDQIMVIVRRHRLGPLLHWQLTRSRPGLSIPESAQAELAVTFKRSTLRALVLRRELVLIHRLLAQAGIPYMALKGAFLAQHAYPQPGLRPLRDLDILVPETEALRAFEVLVAGGLVRPAKYQGNPAAQIQIHKHLPPLHTASGKALVELHARLHNPDDLSPGATDPSTDPAYWQRAVVVKEGPEALCFPAPTDLLLHLIVHAALDHRFSNGPLTLSDIAYLLSKHRIDWDAFWRTAEQCSHERASWLTLRLVERYWGEQSVAWPRSMKRVSGGERVLDQAALLMLRDTRISTDLGLAQALEQQGSGIARVGLSLRRVFPPRVWIAGAYPVRPGSAVVYFYYLPHIWRLLRRRAPQFLRAKRQAPFDDETQRLDALERWLRDEESA